MSIVAIVAAVGPLVATVASVSPQMAMILVHRYRAPRVSSLAFVRVREAVLAGERPDVRQAWVPLDQMSPHLPHAVFAGEDSRFYEHRGFDWEEMRVAWDAWRNGEPLRGASTITQQAARTMYLSPSRSPIRKAREAILTWWMEVVMPKDRILELYLNWAELGVGVYGVEAASGAYFGRGAAGLGRDRAALLAATLPAPRKSNPATPTRGLYRRQARILDRMIRWYGS